MLSNAAQKDSAPASKGMRVLMITGDRRFGPGNPRYELQKSAVEELAVVYWGKGALWPKIPRGTFDVVTAQDPFWRGLFGWHVARRLGTRFNVQVHADVEGQDLIKRALARIVLGRADSVRVVSDRIREQVQSYVRGRVSVLPVFVDVSRFKGLARRPEGKTVLWMGRFEPEKDPLLALEVVAQVPGATLIMLGKGSLEARLKKKAKNLPVEFPGWRDPFEYVSRASAVLSTSRFESWGASIVEALAAGVPVVAPDVGVAKEAGATVVSRDLLGKTVADVLRAPVAGELKLKLLSKDEWAGAWATSLQ